MKEIKYFDELNNLLLDKKLYLGCCVWYIKHHRFIYNSKVSMIGFTSRGIKVGLADDKNFGKLYTLNKDVFITEKEAIEKLRNILQNK